MNPNSTSLRTSIVLILTLALSGASAQAANPYRGYGHHGNFRGGGLIGALIGLTLLDYVLTAPYYYAPAAHPIAYTQPVYAPAPVTQAVPTPMVDPSTPLGTVVGPDGTVYNEYRQANGSIALYQTTR